jgi:hypothetical protein
MPTAHDWTLLGEEATVINTMLRTIELSLNKTHPVCRRIKTIWKHSVQVRGELDDGVCASKPRDIHHMDDGTLITMVFYRTPGFDRCTVDATDIQRVQTAILAFIDHVHQLNVPNVKTKTMTKLHRLGCRLIVPTYFKYNGRETRNPSQVVPSLRESFESVSS